jgi:hypothetical protein
MEASAMIETEVRPVPTYPVERVTKPKLSELLRLGSIDTDQAFFVLSNGLNAFCAVGTILHASGRSVVASMNLQKEVRLVFGGAVDAPQPCPVPHCDRTYNMTAIMTVTHLNDYHEWTRTRIADWLESIGY